ncbi:transcriptional regulator [Vallitalea longa]|uniref:Transcriptional regulator n=1 Tax=Vallitalea longa TaxID=2936439 RepID=A0A9W5Y8M2_9FIRM|nr:helix-turn-helix domain-containing protein [Vallitalea longa]GKX27773.1 transcriptional regulator [Vallitalea longa]
MNIEKLILNPARLRILQFILSNERTTVSSIMETLTDIPRATIYHHMKLLDENGLIQVVEEKRVRNTIEKVYAMNKQNNILEHDNPSKLATGFFMELLQELQFYLSKSDTDCVQDKVFFNTALIAVTDEEYDVLLKEIKDILEMYIKNKMTPERKLRKLSMISSFPVDKIKVGIE